MEQKNFKFDLFVSYASENQEFVADHLIPYLEDTLKLRVCIHERDFTPGKHIVDNISDCIESSKKFFVVFSQDESSAWSQFFASFCKECFPPLGFIRKIDKMGPSRKQEGGLVSSIYGLMTTVGAV